jgi:hypothetical protein
MLDWHTSLVRVGNIPIPVALRVLIQGSKHDRQYDLDVIANQIAEVLVVPEVQRSLSDLEVRACDRLCELVEERFLDFGEFGGVHDFEDVLNLVQEHDLFGAVDFGPVAKKTEDDLSLSVRMTVVSIATATHLFRKSGVLLKELNNAVSELWVVHRQTLHFVERDQHPSEEQLMLFLEW